MIYTTNMDYIDIKLDEDKERDKIKEWLDKHFIEKKENWYFTEHADYRK